MSYTSPYRAQAELDKSRAADYIEKAAQDEEREMMRRSTLKLELQDQADAKKEQIDKEVDQKKQEAEEWGMREKQIIQDRVEAEKQQIDMADGPVSLL